MLGDNYGFGPLTLLLVLLVLGAVVHVCTDERARTFSWLLLGCGATYLAYFVFLSTGNPSYALIGLLLLAASAACVVLARPPAVAIVAVVAVVTIAVVPAHARVLGPFSAAQHGDLYRPDKRVVNLEATAQFLAKVQHKGPFVGGWWATVEDLEYMLPTVSNFVRVENVAQSEMHDGRLLVRNKFWTSFAPAPLFTTWAKTCDRVVFSAPPYLVTQCPQSRASDQLSTAK